MYLYKLRFVRRGRHLKAVQMLFLFNSYAALLDPGDTLGVLGWLCLLEAGKEETQRFCAGKPRAAEAWGGAGQWCAAADL